MKLRSARTCVCVFVCSRRLYGIKCAKCNIGFSKNDFVMRARSKVYHIECFRCVACSRQLIPGDEFALREDGLFCRADHDVVERASLGTGDPLSPLHPARPLQMAGKVPSSGRQATRIISAGRKQGSCTLLSVSACDFFRLQKFWRFPLLDCGQVRLKQIIRQTVMLHAQINCTSCTSLFHWLLGAALQTRNIVFKWFAGQIYILMQISCSHGETAPGDITNKRGCCSAHIELGEVFCWTGSDVCSCRCMFCRLRLASVFFCIPLSSQTRLGRLDTVGAAGRNTPSYHCWRKSATHGCGSGALCVWNGLEVFSSQEFPANCHLDLMVYSVGFDLGSDESIRAALFSYLNLICSEVWSSWDHETWSYLQDYFKQNRQTHFKVFVAIVLNVWSWSFVAFKARCLLRFIKPETFLWGLLN